MTKLSRFAKPSWWSYHWNHRNILRFWLQYLGTRPFPDNWTSIDDIVAFGKQHRIIGFNHECIRSYILWRLHQHFHCTSFVETGTLYGQTAAFVQRVFKTPIFTSEINPTYQFFSRANLLWSNGINIFRSSSPDFLTQVCDPAVIGADPMFYLDAHWYDYIPLPDELRIIGDRCERGLIIIDDFFIPWEPRFRYDHYPSLRIDLDVISSALGNRRKDLSIYLPAYNPDEEPYGKATGFAVIMMGQPNELPTGTFPFDLLAKAPIGPDAAA